MTAFDELSDPAQKGGIVKSAYDSESFEADGSIHVQGLVGSATISPSGRDIALASPEGLAIIDLDSPYSPPRRLRSPGMPWLVVDVQWSPFSARDYWVVSTANHRALVWNLNMRDDSSTGAIEHTLQGHTRAITDVNFSAHHPDFLATCAMDGNVHRWDLRRPRQPVLTFCDWFAGASQVKSNRRDAHILASAHDRWLHIWDERNPSKPLKSIGAHSSKIYGLDWNRTDATGVVTCSVDQTIKFWNYGADGDVPEHVIHTGYPVWRARHTPFGSGLLAMPQNAPGDLYLYDRLWSKDKSAEASQRPVAVFDGHGEYKVKEFLWRSRGGITEDHIDTREFQLVSWGTDNEVRLHCIDAGILQSVGYRKDQPADEGLSLTRSGAIYKTFRAVDDHATRDRRTGTMKDPRQGLGDATHKHSTLTAGMRSIGAYNHHGSTRSAWRGPSMKAKVITRKNLDKSQAQIGWMKGITIAKRKASTHHGRRLTSKDPNMFGHGYPDDQWAEPETIQEEVLRISKQIPKVKWENIDMDSMTLTASLKGPWGKDSETIFLKVKIDIPPNYPKIRAPKFWIEDTSFMSESMRKRLEKELHQVAEQFLRKRQNCLEVVFTYLLGEVDLEASTTFFKNVRDLDDDVLVDDSSSEEDEDVPAGGSVSMSQELMPHADGGDTMGSTPARIIIPPPPLTCGARFSADGRLVCFFPSKEEKARVLFQTAELGSKDRAKGEPIFAGFGRLAHDPPSRRKYTTDDASATEDQSDSEESDDSSSSSSDSESTSIHRMSLWYHTTNQLRDTYSEDLSIRSSGGGTGTGIGTATGTGTGRRRPGRPRNLISIHDLRADLPSKKEFAQEYAIFGDGAVICKHNASVAEKYGCTDLKNVWLYLSLLLKKGIPLELLASNQRRGSILVIARETVSRVLEEETKDLPSDNNNNNNDDDDDELQFTDSTLFGRVKWGRHPLAEDFIQELFDYFEKIADIQMLAMLSCIFSESSSDDNVAYVESQLPHQDTPLPMKAPSFSLDYFPTDATMWNIYGQRALHSTATTPGTIYTPLHYTGSHASDEMTWAGAGETGAGANSFSCGETPPSKGRSWIEPPEASFNLLSKSPTNRSLARVSSGAVNPPYPPYPPFSTNIPRSYNGSSSSPPYPFRDSRKKPSPAEAMMLSSFTPRPGYASPRNPNPNPNLYPTSFAEAPTGRTSVPDDEYRREDVLPLVPVSVSVFVEDQTVFDDDGWLTTPLLDAGRTSIHANYRYAYAEMLQLWGQPLARLEVMKFNVLKEDQPPNQEDTGFHHDSSFTLHDSASGGGGGGGAASHPKSASPPIIMGKKDQVQMLVASGRGLDVTGVCSVHETQLDPVRYTSSESTLGGAVGTCDRCRRVQNQLRCVYCLEPVDALFPPCLSCGCISHEGCLADWHAAGESFCPAGDECNCVEEAANGLVESWAALRGTVMLMPCDDADPNHHNNNGSNNNNHNPNFDNGYDRSRSRGLSKAHSLSRISLLPPALDSEDEARDEDAEGADDRAGEWERVGHNVPSRAQGESAPSLSFVRFKNTAQTWSRASSQRRSTMRSNG